MGRYMTFAWIFLILSIIDFARAAPVVARRVDVAEHRSATSQKRSKNDFPHPSSGSLNSPIPWVPDKSGHSWPRQLLPNDPGQASPAQSWPSHLSADPANTVYSWPKYLPADNPGPSSTVYSWPKHLPADNAGPSSTVYSWPKFLPADNLNPNPGDPSSPVYSWPSELPADYRGPSSTVYSWPDYLPVGKPHQFYTWPSYLPADLPAADNSHPVSSWPSYLPAGQSHPIYSWPINLPEDNSDPPSPDSPGPNRLSAVHPLPLPPVESVLGPSTGPHQSTDPNRPPSPSPEPAPVPESDPVGFLDKLLKDKIRRRTSAENSA